MPLNPAQPPKLYSIPPAAMSEWYDRAEGATPCTRAERSVQARAGAAGSSIKRSLRLPAAPRDGRHAR
jgi:hypothetical protein